MWTINNCSIVSSTPTYRQQSVGGSTTKCRTDEPKFIFGKNNLKAERWKQEWYKEEFCLQRSSINIWPTFQHRLRTSIWSSTPMTLPSTHPDQWWLTYSMASTYTCASAQLHLQQKTDSVNGQVYSNTIHARYSRAPLTSTSEVGDQVLPLVKKSKVIGVTLDTHLTFTQHCNNIVVKLLQRNNVLKALAGSTSGCDKETLLTTY